MPKARNRHPLRFVLLTALILLLAAGVWAFLLRPTRVLVVNATLAQQADVALNNDCRRIRLRFADADRIAADGKPLRGTDAAAAASAWPTNWTTAKSSMSPNSKL